MEDRAWEHAVVKQLCVFAKRSLGQCHVIPPGQAANPVPQHSPVGDTGGWVGVHGHVGKRVNLLHCVL